MRFAKERCKETIRQKVQLLIEQEAVKKAIKRNTHTNNATISGAVVLVKPSVEGNQALITHLVVGDKMVNVIPIFDQSIVNVPFGAVWMFNILKDAPNGLIQFPEIEISFADTKSKKNIYKPVPCKSKHKNATVGP